MSFERVDVEFHEVRDYGEWNRVQNIIESRKEWAIVYIHRFGKEDEQWEVWVEGNRYDSCASLSKAQKSVLQAKKERGYVY